MITMKTSNDHHLIRYNSTNNTQECLTNRHVLNNITVVPFIHSCCCRSFVLSVRFPVRSLFYAFACGIIASICQCPQRARASKRPRLNIGGARLSPAHGPLATQHEHLTLRLVVLLEFCFMETCLGLREDCVIRRGRIRATHTSLENIWADA